jgi:hypothetical protein
VRIGGIGLDAPAKQLHGLARIALVEAKHPQEVEHIGIARRATQEAQVSGFRLLQPPLLMGGDRSLEQ